MSAAMRFAEVVGWGDESWERDVSGVAVAPDDRVYVLRQGDAPVTVFEPDGARIGVWGQGQFSARPHLISISDERQAYVADDGGHCISIFDLNGQLLETIGSGVASETAYDANALSAEAALDALKGGPPFNRPTKAAPGHNGELFVSDGYRNCRVHRFSADRQLTHSWGGAGAGEGCFVIPHSVTVDSEERVFVCDRENDRIQIFSGKGLLLDVWNDVQRPTDVAFDRHGHVYVTELPRGPRDLKSWRLGRADRMMPGRVTIRSSTGEMIGEIECAGVSFGAPHAIAVDSRGAVYVSEVPQSMASYTGLTFRPQRCLRKFEPV
jgi:DNA-binding beta-propeller fold protein YncE